MAAGLVHEISTTSVADILDGAEIKPHRVKMWCHSKDPDYQKKMRAIVRLYVRRPKGEPILCIDEKTGMQALSRARDLQLAKPGRAAALGSSIDATGHVACSAVSMSERAASWVAAPHTASARTSSPSWTRWPRPTGRLASTWSWTT